jgi:hypothetical protein
MVSGASAGMYNSAPGAMSWKAEPEMPDTAVLNSTRAKDEQFSKQDGGTTDWYSGKSHTNDSKLAHPENWPPLFVFIDCTLGMETPSRSAHPEKDSSPTVVQFGKDKGPFSLAQPVKAYPLTVMTLDMMDGENLSNDEHPPKALASNVEKSALSSTFVSEVQLLKTFCPDKLTHDGAITSHTLTPEHDLKETTGRSSPNSFFTVVKSQGVASVDVLTAPVPETVSSALFFVLLAEIVHTPFDRYPRPDLLNATPFVSV